MVYPSPWSRRRHCRCHVCGPRDLHTLTLWEYRSSSFCSTLSLAGSRSASAWSTLYFMLPGQHPCTTRSATRVVRSVRAVWPRSAFGSTASKTAYVRLPRSRIGLYASLALSGGFLLAVPSSGPTTAAGVEHVKLSRRPDDGQTDADLIARLDSNALSKSSHHLQSLPFGALVRSYAVFLACSSSVLVDIAPATNDFLESARDTLPLGLGHLLWQPFIFVSDDPPYSAGCHISADMSRSSSGDATYLLQTICSRRKRRRDGAAHRKPL